MSDPNIQKYELSAPAAHCAQVLLQNFEFKARPGSRVQPTERNLAILIDVCTQVFRLQNVVDHLVRQNPWYSRDELSRNMERLREAVRAVEMVRNHMPQYPNGNGVVVGERQSAPPELSNSQKDQLQQVSKALSQARTVSEEQRILRAAGLVR